MTLEHNRCIWVRVFHSVMAGLDPAIHATIAARNSPIMQDECAYLDINRPECVDGRVKPGHDV
jgi:hypothetical protein